MKQLNESEIKTILFETAQKTVTEKGFDIVIQFEEQANVLLKYFESCQEQSKESDGRFYSYKEIEQLQKEAYNAGFSNGIE